MLLGPSLPSIPFLDSSVGNNFMIAGLCGVSYAPPTDEEWNGLREEGQGPRAWDSYWAGVRKPIKC